MGKRKQDDPIPSDSDQPTKRLRRSTRSSVKATPPPVAPVAPEEEDEAKEVTPVKETPRKAATKKAKAAAKKPVKPALVKKESSGSLGDWLPPPTDFTKPALDGKQIKIVTWNVASWRAVLKKGFEEYIKNEDPAIILINETKINQNDVPEDVIPGYHAYFYSPTEKKGYSGVGLLTKEEPLSVVRGIGIDQFDTEGRCITAEFDKYYLVSTYIPNSGQKKGPDRYPINLPDRLEWDVAFQKYLHELDKKKPVIWAGDLNVARTEIDLKNPKTNKKNAGFTPQERESFEKFLASGFVDSYRHRYPEEEDCYTFWSFRGFARPKNVGWRLDYFVVSERIIDNVKESYIRKNVLGSDHCPIAIHLEL